MEKTKERKIVGILKDKKQSRITIPDEFVKIFDINPKTDTFAWVITEEDGMLLSARLLKNVKKTT